MVEWSITTVLKTVVPRGTGGSNPSLSAEAFLCNHQVITKEFQGIQLIAVNSMSYGNFRLCSLEKSGYL